MSSVTITRPQRPVRPRGGTATRRRRRRVRCPGCGCRLPARGGPGQVGSQAVLVVAALAVLLMVAGAGSASAETVVLAQAPSIDVVLTNIRNWLIGILAGLATVFLTIGGVRRVVAGGDPGEVEASNRCFRSAGWGYGLAALAPVVVEILRSIVGV